MSIDRQFLSNESQDRYTVRLGNISYSLTDRMILLIIIVVAVTLRLLSAIYQGNTVSNLPGIYDQISYDGLARRIITGYGFSFAEGHWPATQAGEPTAHWSYLYTLYLVAVYELFGTFPIAARIIQALIAGVFHILFIWRISARIFNRTVGLVAATLTAVYIYFFYYAGGLITETFYVIGILWVFDSSFRIVDGPQTNRPGLMTKKWLQWLELGLAMGVTVLLRQVFLLFLPFLYVWLWLNLRDDGAGGWKKHAHWSSIKRLLFVSLILVLMIIPWTYRNSRAFGTFVLLNTNAGFAFFWGNHPVHGTNFMPVLPSGAQGYYNLIPANLLPLNEAELDRALLKLGIQFVLDDPKRFFLLSISRMKEFIKFWPSSDSEVISNLSRVGSFGICLPFILYGVWLMLTQNWKTRAEIKRWAIVLLLVFIFVYTTIHLFSWTLIRYRLPIDAVLIIFAALGVETLMRKIHLFKET